MRFWVWLLVGMMALAAWPAIGYGQDIRLDVQAEPLEHALGELRSQAAADVVYAHRLVEDVTVSCQYDGNEVADALQCLLQAVDLEAERVRQGQYVLVEADDSSAAPEETEPEPEGAISGYVIDAESGEELPGAHVYIPELQAGTTTDQAGHFTLASYPEEAYEVQISYIGFETRDTTLAEGNSPVRVALEPTAIAGGDVEVEGESPSTASSERVPGMLALELDELDRVPSFGEQDLFHALRWTAGVRRSGVINEGLSVRGASPDQNLYLLDGAPVYHPWHAFSLVSVFQTGTLESADLYRSAFPVEYGGRLSSVMDAQLRGGTQEETRATAGISALSGRFMVETPLSESTSLMVSGRRSHLDQVIGREHPVEDAAGRRDTLRTGYYFYDLSAKLTSRISERHKLSVSAYRGRDDLDLRLPFDLSLDFSSWLRPADLFFELRQDWGNQIVSAQHEYMASDRLFLTTTGYYSGYRAQEGSFVQPTGTASLTSDYEVKLDDGGIKLDADYHHSASHQFQAGVQAMARRFRSTLRSDLQRSAADGVQMEEESKVRPVELVGYVQNIWNPTPDWEVQSGVRLSYFSSGGHMHVRPRVNVRYTVHPDYLSLRGAVGTQVQYLHQVRDRHSLAYDLVSTRWIPASGAIDPAKGAQVSIGAQSEPWSGVVLEANAHARTSSQALVPEDPFQTKDGLEGPGIEMGALMGQYTPASERAYGMEISALFERGPWRMRLESAAARTLVQAPALDGDRYRPADLDVPRSFRGIIGWDRNGWTASLAAEVRSGYPESEPTSQYEVGNPVDGETVTYLHRPFVNNGRLPTYARIDATIGYQFRLINVDWQAKVNIYNVTNRDNVVSRRFIPNDDGMKVNRRHGLPILPLFEIEANF